MTSNPIDEESTVAAAVAAKLTGEFYVGQRFTLESFAGTKWTACVLAVHDEAVVIVDVDDLECSASYNKNLLRRSRRS